MTRRPWCGTWTRAGLFLLLALAGAVTNSAEELPALRLTPENAKPGTYFGLSVAIDDGRALIGDIDEDAAYLFDVKSAQPLAKFTLEDAKDDSFGYSVALNQGKALIGGYGAAYLFDVKTGKHIGTLRPDDESRTSEFGKAVALDNGIALVGSRNREDKEGNRLTGAAFLFDVQTGKQTAILLPDAVHEMEFGMSVAIDNGIAMVGTPCSSQFIPDARTRRAAREGPVHFPTGKIVQRPGAAYVFDAMTGKRLARLQADDAEEGDNFGWSVAMDSGIALIGASGRRMPAAYLFDVDMGNQLAKLVPEQGNSPSKFGDGVALDENSALVAGNRSLHLFDIKTGKQLPALRDKIPTLTATPRRKPVQFTIRQAAIKNGVVLVGMFDYQRKGVAHRIDVGEILAD